MDFARRTSYIDISGIRRMFELASRREVINLGLGEPDFPIPEASKRAVIEALEKDHTHYTPTQGQLELRERIARRLSRKGMDASPEEIIITSGASEALLIALLALINPGDEVLIPDPGFVSYAPLTRMAGGVPVRYLLRKEDGFQPRREEVEGKLTGRTRCIVVNTPSNPTGAVLERRALEEIACMAEERSIPVLSDEVYDEIVYEGAHWSIARSMEHAVTINSFSKTYAMTGLRLGYLHARPEFIQEMLKLHQYIQASTCSLSQAAAIAALKEGEGFIKKMVKTLRRRRELMVRLLNEIDGVHCQKPGGAFYVFPDFSAHGSSSELALRMAKEAGVVVTPGSAFGESSPGHLRLSYATSEEKIGEGVSRIRSHLERHG